MLQDGLSLVENNICKTIFNSYKSKADKIQNIILNKEFSYSEYHACFQATGEEDLRVVKIKTLEDLTKYCQAINKTEDLGRFELSGIDL